MAFRNQKTVSRRGSARQSLQNSPTVFQVCTKLCPNRMHKCDMIHSTNVACPPCTYHVHIKKRCGHTGFYRCYNALAQASSAGCYFCAIENYQCHQNAMPTVPPEVIQSHQPMQTTYYNTNSPIMMFQNPVSVGIPQYHEYVAKPQNAIGSEMSRNSNFSRMTQNSESTEMSPNFSFNGMAQNSESTEMSPNFSFNGMAQNSESTEMSPNFSFIGMSPDSSKNEIHKWMMEMSDSVTRENAMFELARRDTVADLAETLWYSYGTMSILLYEIVSMYPHTHPTNLTTEQSKRGCNALALLQSVTANTVTAKFFLEARMETFLYPLLHTTSTTMPFEFLRMNCFTVFANLLKNGDDDVIKVLLTTEIIRLCLQAMNLMETGKELSVTVAAFILQKILLNDAGLKYVCQTHQSYLYIINILGKMVVTLATDPCARLLKIIVRCYLRFSEDYKVRKTLRAQLPAQLKDSTFSSYLTDEQPIKLWLSQLFENIQEPRARPAFGIFTEDVLTLQKVAEEEAFAITKDFDEGYHGEAEASFNAVGLDYAPKFSNIWNFQ